MAVDTIGKEQAGVAGLFHWRLKPDGVSKFVAGCSFLVILSPSLRSRINSAKDLLLW